MIDICNLSKNFGHKHVLENVNVRYETGCMYGIVGENGAGKTTLFRCIAGLEAYEGEIKSDSKPLKNQLGLLLTEPFFFPKITGKEYIQMLCSARQKKASAIDEKNIFDLPLNQYASTYSTGMKKKLALTAILLQENQYFVLDEPFNGVDIHSNMLIVGLINKLKELGKTVIISSHILSTLYDTCDEIHVLKNKTFTQKITRENFHTLENEMKEFSVENKIEKLDLR